MRILFKDNKISRAIYNIISLIKIYRTKKLSNDFYLLDIINDQQYIDIKLDTELITIYNKVTLI